MNSSTNLIKCPVCGESSFKKIDDVTCKCNIYSSTFLLRQVKLVNNIQLK